jgi:hypothetical protein
VRDGQRHFLTGPLPVYTKPQKRHRDPVSHELMRAKVVKVRKRGYVSPGVVTSGTHYFSVPKGLDDIRMVYNGTSCGLNDVLWAPRFGLPTVKQTLRALLTGYLQCDLDVGEQFPIFFLHEELRQYSGVDVREVRSSNPADVQWEEGRGPGPWERWERNWMGLRDSPYRSLQWQVRLMYEVYGDRKDRTNPYHWTRVEFNLPGSKGYRSDLPWVMKLREDGHLAAVRLCGRWSDHRILSGPHLESGEGLRIWLFKERDPGRVQEANVAHGVPWSLGWHCDPHRLRASGWDGVTREVGQDKVPAGGVEGDGDKGSPALTADARDQRFLHVCRAYLHLVESLHERNAPHSRQLATGTGGGRFQNDTKRNPKSGKQSLGPDWAAVQA